MAFIKVPTKESYTKLTATINVDHIVKVTPGSSMSNVPAQTCYIELSTGAYVDVTLPKSKVDELIERCATIHA